MKHYTTFLSIASIAIALMSCNKEKADQIVTPDVSITNSAFIQNYSNIVYASYTDSYTEAVKLTKACQSFLDNPNTTSLEQAKEAWRNARVPYDQTEPYRFYNGPIDDENGPEGLINGWPLDESYIDYVIGNNKSGIIFDTITYPTISKDVLAQLNQVGGENNISTGYHAIEFLLWGQDTSLSTSGTRPYTDYVLQGTYTEKMYIKRRREYLLAACQLLEDHLSYLVNAWSPNVGSNYRSTFLALSENQALNKIFIGLKEFNGAEFSGERIYASMDPSRQEEEHSCFSDYTSTDIKYWQKGIKNIYEGRYVRLDGGVVEGTGIHKLLMSKNASTASLMDTRISSSDEAIAQIVHAFDKEITLTEGYSRMNKVVTALENQGAEWGTVALKFGVTGSID